MSVNKAQSYFLKGFTLVELLVAIAILTILTGMGFASFSRSQKKARDGERKSDLHQIQQALEAYANDHNGRYPEGYNEVPTDCEDSGGRMVILDDAGECLALEWGISLFNDRTIDNGATYMQQLPIDPSTSQKYFYWSDGTCYKIYAKLENTDDKDIISPVDTTDCSVDEQVDVCTFGVASTNASVTEAGCL